MNYDRRSFIKAVSLAGLSLPVSPLIRSAVHTGQANSYPLYFFTKPLDGFEASFMAETLAEAGINGFDLALRQKGRVEPERVADDLPSIIEIGKKHRLATEMMVTGFTDVTDPNCEQVLKTAASLGIKHYRLGYYTYDLKKGIPASLEEIKRKLGRFAELNAKYKIQTGFQNHSGDRVGAPLWDIWELIKDFPVASISNQFDIRHAVAEGAYSWVLALNLLKKNIGSVAIKDFTWEINNGKARIKNVPLGEGIVDFERFFDNLKQLNIKAPISIHVEYPMLTKAQQQLPLLQKQRIYVTAIKKDVDFVKNYLTRFQLS